MNPRRILKNVCTNLAAGMLFSSALSNPCLAGEKHFDVNLDKQIYEVYIDKEKLKYRIDPKSDKTTRKEVLASALIQDLIENTEKRKNVLENKIEEFLYENPSDMELKVDSKDADLKLTNQDFPYTEPPKFNVSAHKIGNKLQVKFILDSQEYFIRWLKDCSIIIGYPKGTKIFRRFDRIYEFNLNERDIYGKYKSREVSFSEEREVAGMLLESFEDKVKAMAKEQYGLEAKALLFPVELEEWLKKRDRIKRETHIKTKLSKREWVRYQPTSSIPAGFQSPYESGRLFALDFKGKPERIDFFINTNLFLNKINESHEETSLKNNRVVIKMISVGINEPTKRTIAGKLIGIGRDIDSKIESIIKEYSKNKITTIEEKESFYYKLKLWNEEIMPFVSLLGNLHEKELRGELNNLEEYKEFKQKTEFLQKSFLPLKSILIMYQEKDKIFRAENTEKYLNVIAEAARKYQSEVGYYPKNLENLLSSRYLKELKTDEWGNEISYTNLGDGFEIRSAGKDEKMTKDYRGTDDVFVCYLSP